MIGLCVILGFLFAFRWGFFECKPLIGWAVVGVLYFTVCVGIDCMVVNLGLKYCESYTPPTQVNLSAEAIEKVQNYNKLVNSTKNLANNPIVSKVSPGNLKRANALNKIDIDAYGYYIPTTDEWQRVQEALPDALPEDSPEGMPIDRVPPEESMGGSGSKGSEFTDPEVKEALVPG